MEKTETKKSTTYSSEDVERLIELYADGKGMSTKDIAKEMDRAPRSVIGKLVSLGKYVKAEKVPKTFVDTGPSKKELQRRLEVFLPKEVVEGLSNAKKSALEFIATSYEKQATPEADATVETPVEQVA